MRTSQPWALVLFLALVSVLSLGLTGCGEDEECPTAPLHPSSLYVRADGLGEYPTIQAAVDSADSAEVVELEDGVYTGPGNRDIDLRGKAIAIRSVSGDPATCVIDCQGDSLDPHWGFESLVPSSLLKVEGLTIRNGCGTGDAGRLSSGLVGGVYVYGCTYFEMTSCVVEECAGVGWGSGVDCDSTKARFSACTFSGNTGSAMVCLSSTVDLVSCLFEGNTGNTGAAVLGRQSFVHVSASTFSDNVSTNHGGAVTVDDELRMGASVFRNNSSVYGGAVTFWGAFLDIFGCRFEGNQAITGGGALEYAPSPPLGGYVTGRVTASEFVRNAADIGGGVAVYKGDLDVASCVFYADSAAVEGAAITTNPYSPTSVLSVSNTVIVGCVGDDSGPLFGGGSNNNVNCCSFYNNAPEYGGAGVGTNILRDPLFCDPAGDDFHLRAGSPCLPESTGCGRIGAYGQGCE